MRSAVALQPVGGTIVLHTATAEDAADVARLLTQMGYPCDSREATARIAATTAEPSQDLLIAHCDGRGVALLGLDFMYYLPLGVTTCRLTTLVVDVDARRTGLGRLLLQEAERRARQAGAARLEVASALHRREAHAFYRACAYSDGSLRFTKPLGPA